MVADVWSSMVKLNETYRQKEPYNMKLDPTQQGTRETIYCRDIRDAGLVNVLMLVRPDCPSIHNTKFQHSHVLGNLCMQSKGAWQQKDVLHWMLKLKEVRRSTHITV